MDEGQQALKGHKLIINTRKTVSITGVNDVLSFDAGEVLCRPSREFL